MKKIFLLILTGLFLTFTGCGDDSGGSTGTDPFGSGGSGGNNTGNVTVTVSAGQDNDGNTYLGFAPNPASVVTSIVAVCTALSINETVPITTGEVYSANNILYVSAPGLAIGQAWQLTIKGNVGSASGTAFSTSVNYTVQ
jgi:hypothetical protein